MIEVIHLRAITLHCVLALFIASTSIVQAGTTAPPIAVSVFSGPRTSEAQLASAHRLLQRLESDGWFIRIPASSALKLDACSNVQKDGEIQCRDALQKLAGNTNMTTSPNVAFVFTSARNQLANLQCLGAGPYRISARQDMLADYRLALSEDQNAETERAKIAGCLLLASRELAAERSRQQDHFACATKSLAGEWLANDGLVIRFEGPFTDPYSQAGEGRAIVVRPGLQKNIRGDVLYSKIRRMADCSFLVTRHLWLDLKLHAAPPHIVLLELDRAQGTLIDNYQGKDNSYTRLEGPLPIKGIKINE